MSLYRLQDNGADSLEAIAIAQGLLKFVAIYVVFDAMQLILAGSLRGAGDTWFVLGAGIVASACSPNDRLSWRTKRRCTLLVVEDGRGLDLDARDADGVPLSARKMETDADGIEPIESRSKRLPCDNAFQLDK